MRAFVLLPWSLPLSQNLFRLHLLLNNAPLVLLRHLCNGRRRRGPCGRGRGFGSRARREDFRPFWCEGHGSAKVSGSRVSCWDFYSFCFFMRRGKLKWQCTKLHIQINSLNHFPAAGVLLTGVQTPLAQTNWVVVVGLVAGFISDGVHVLYTLFILSPPGRCGSAACRFGGRRGRRRGFLRGPCSGP